MGKKTDFGQVHFACVTIELGGGLPKFYTSQARFLSYQTPVVGTGIPLNEPWIEEVMSKKSGVQTES